MTRLIIKLESTAAPAATSESGSKVKAFIKARLKEVPMALIMALIANVLIKALVH